MKNRKFLLTVILTFIGFTSVMAQPPAEAGRMDLSTPQEFLPPAGRELILEEMFPIGLSNGDLLMVYRLWPLGGQTNDVLYSARSNDGGVSWDAQPFTRYVGQDVTSHTTLLNDQPFLQFNSSRWKPLINIDAAWYGILEVTVDSNPHLPLYGEKQRAERRYQRCDRGAGPGCRRDLAAQFTK